MAGSDLLAVVPFLAVEYEDFRQVIPPQALKSRISALVTRFNSAGIGGAALMERLTGSTGWTSLSQMWPALAAFEIFQGSLLHTDGTWIHQPDGDARLTQLRDAFAGKEMAHPA